MTNLKQMKSMQSRTLWAVLDSDGDVRLYDQPPKTRKGYLMVDHHVGYLPLDLFRALFRFSEPLEVFYEHPNHCVYIEPVYEAVELEVPNAAK